MDVVGEGVEGFADDAHALHVGVALLARGRVMQGTAWESGRVRSGWGRGAAPSKEKKPLQLLEAVKSRPKMRPVLRRPKERRLLLFHPAIRRAQRNRGGAGSSSTTTTNSSGLGSCSGSGGALCARNSGRMVRGTQVGWYDLRLISRGSILALRRVCRRCFGGSWRAVKKCASVRRFGRFEQAAGSVTRGLSNAHLSDRCRKRF